MCCRGQEEDRLLYDRTVGCKPGTSDASEINKTSTNQATKRVPRKLLYLVVFAPVSSPSRLIQRISNVKAERGPCSPERAAHCKSLSAKCQEKNYQVPTALAGKRQKTFFAGSKLAELLRVIAAVSGPQAAARAVVPKDGTDTS